MKKVLLIQLPVPKSNFGARTGNIPLAGACLAQAAQGLDRIQVDILDPHLSTHAGDRLLLDLITRSAPDILGFSVYAWNLDRSLFLARQAKKQTGCRVILGGPEVSPDNNRVQGEFIDAKVFGEGEVPFWKFLAGHTDSLSAPACFSECPSPYPAGLLTAGPNTPLMLETQRGCPFRCGFCRYNKSRGKVVFKDPSHIWDAIVHARAKGVTEVFFLDPTLNARPDLASFLKTLARLNPDRNLSFASEIRADTITGDLAKWFYRAGFTEFETGLQSTNPNALKQMGRPTDPVRFLEGCNALLDQGIRIKTDLIVGLPGDDLKGFLNSLEFVMTNGLHEHIQVFPLLLLTGTRFRRDSDALGLCFDPAPPYTVRHTPIFSQTDIRQAFDAAEDLLDLALIPMPDLDLSWKASPLSIAGHQTVGISGHGVITKVILDRPRSVGDLERTAARLSSPYQIFALAGLDSTALETAIACFTRSNPFTPLEVVFLEPGQVPDTQRLLACAHLHRPHFLDKDLDLLYPKPGNRAVIFTLVSALNNHFFHGPMMRQVYWWKHKSLPTVADLSHLSFPDGILLDTPHPDQEIKKFQTQLKPLADRLPLITFSGIAAQRQWQKMISPDDYDSDLFYNREN